MEQKQISSLGCWGVSNTISLVLLEYNYDIDDRATTALLVRLLQSRKTRPATPLILHWANNF